MDSLKMPSLADLLREPSSSVRMPSLADILREPSSSVRMPTLSDLSSTGAPKKQK